MLVRADTHVLAEGAAHLGVHLGEQQLGLFRRYHQLLVDWNQRVNLTSVVEWDAVQRTHFLDSLTGAKVIAADVLAAGRALDVGSGAGFPGVPLKIAFPGLRMGLLEATGKKLAFLTHLVRELGLEGVDLLHGRAEDLAHDLLFRSAFDVVLARATGSMAVLAELALPFARPGGLLVAQKKGDFQGELAAAEFAIREMGGLLEEVRWVELLQLGEPRALVVVRKVNPTPDRYPRRSGMPAKRPLLAKGDRR